MTKKKNVQIIDGARNCTYDIFWLPEPDFRLMFPGQGQDVEFVEDFFSRDKEEAQRIWASMWTRRVDKKVVVGIHGTIFCRLTVKKRFYPTKSEAEMVTGVPRGRVRIKK